MRKTGKGQKKPKSEAEWLSLFDTSEMDHVCEAVRINIINVSLGSPSAMYEPLRKYLVAPLGAYIDDHWEAGKSFINVTAAQALLEDAELLADRFEERHPFGEDVAPALAESLRIKWLEFIAYGAAHYIYWEIPKRSARMRRLQTKTRRSGAGGDGPKQLTAKVVADYYKANPTKTDAECKAALEHEYSVSGSTVSRRKAEAKSKGLLKS